MTRLEERIASALRTVGDKPSDTAPAPQKKRYSESLSQAIAIALGSELRERGCVGARPVEPGVLDESGAERRMSGGIGAKKVDVTWTTEEAGLLLAISVKSINFRDKKSQNFQKNLTNRRGDMLFEAVTLHRRFPFAVLGGIFFLDYEANSDETGKRRSTFLNAHRRFKLFTDRDDPEGREEQYEKFWLVLVEASSNKARTSCFRVGAPESKVSWDSMVEDLLELTALRNPDFYEFDNGTIRRM